MNNGLLCGSGSEALKAIYWKLPDCILVVHMSMHEKFLARTHDVGWKDADSISNPNDIHFHLFSFVQR